MAGINVRLGGGREGGREGGRGAGYLVPAPSFLCRCNVRLQGIERDEFHQLVHLVLQLFGHFCHHKQVDLIQVMKNEPAVIEYVSDG